jgi:hypothetical protein
MCKHIARSLLMVGNHRELEWHGLILPASMIVCCDGGANQLRKILDENKPPFNRVSHVRISLKASGLDCLV